MNKETVLKEIITNVSEFAPEFKRLFMTARESDKPSAVHKLTSLQYMTLIALGMASEQPVTMNKLSAILNISKQQTTKLVDGLVGENFVTRYTNPNNRREVLAELTLDGFERLATFRQAQYEAMLGYFEDFTNEEMTEILGHVRALFAIFGKKKGAKECAKD